MSKNNKIGLFFIIIGLLALISQVSSVFTHFVYRFSGPIVLIIIGICFIAIKDKKRNKNDYKNSEENSVKNDFEK